MKLKEINDKLIKISNDIKGTKDLVLKSQLIEQLKELKKTITFESVEDWQEEYKFNEKVNKECWEKLNNEESINIREYNDYYDLYYKTKATMGRIKKQYESNIEMIDAMIEAYSGEKKNAK